MYNSNFYNYDFTEDYTAAEKTRYILHLMIAIASIPLNFINGYAGLILLPYILFVTFKPRSEYLLPIIIILAYSSPLRIIFCTCCFFYVLFNMSKLYQYRLNVIWWMYLALLPFFIWYFNEKLNYIHNVTGAGDLAAGFGTYFIISCAFWAIISIKKIGNTFCTGIFYWSFFLVVMMTFFGSGALDYGEESVGRIGAMVFTRQSYLAISIVAGMFIYKMLRHQLLTMTGVVAILGVVFFVLDFCGLMRFKLTFTGVGLIVVTSMYIYFSKIHNNLCKKLNPIWFFILSIVLVFLSAELVKRYGGMYSEYGLYEEIKTTNFESIKAKLIRKAIDDRASVWDFNLMAIKKQMMENPIFIKIRSYAEADVYVEGQGFVSFEMTMSPHNTMLYLLREFGLYGGGGLYLMYLWCFCCKKTTSSIVSNGNMPVLVIVTACVAQGVIGGHTGHYPMILSFGPVLFSLLGACWRFNYEHNSFVRE